MKSIFTAIVITLFCSFGTNAARGQDKFPNLKTSGADWGIWIDHGLVNPGEAVGMTISVPLTLL